MANDTPMRTNDLDRDVLSQDTDFILGTSLAGWIAGLALCVSILLLAASPTAIALGTLISTLILSAWLARRLRNNR